MTIWTIAIQPITVQAITLQAMTLQVITRKSGRLLCLPGRLLLHYPKVDYCAYRTHSAHVRSKCPRTCGTCLTDAPPMPESCSDASYTGLTIDGMDASCGELVGYCRHRTYGSTVRERCPRTCGACRGDSRRQARAIITT